MRFTNINPHVIVYKKKRMKILLMGDASNYHCALGSALRSMGHEVVVASNGSGMMDTRRDIDISRPKEGKLGGLLLWLRLLGMKSRLSGYDVVQLVNPIFVDLKPVRVRQLFDYLRHHNKKVCLTALGTDTAYVECATDVSRLRYSEWQVDGVPTEYATTHRNVLDAWLSAPVREHCDYVYRHVAGVGTALYEYDLACRGKLSPERVQYCGIPIDTRAITPVMGDGIRGKVRIFIGLQRGRMLEKGTDRLLAVAQEVVARHADKAELVVVENLPYAEYVEQMCSCHLMLDQIYSYTPATNALLAMARGMAVMSGGEPEYYDFIGERENRSIINAVPDDDLLRRQLEDGVLHPRQLEERGQRGREFVMKHNDSIVVARRFVELWERD